MEQSGAELSGAEWSRVERSSGASETATEVVEKMRRGFKDGKGGD